ncbi:hypothetical protein AB3N60_16950 [Leptospira sp. WS39.C2]
MVALKVVDPGKAYMESNNLKPIWKKQLDNIDGEISAVDKELSTVIDNLNYVNDRKSKLLKQREIVLQKATEQGLPFNG